MVMYIWNEIIWACEGAIVGIRVGEMILRVVGDSVGEAVGDSVGEAVGVLVTLRIRFEERSAKYTLPTPRQSGISVSF